MNVNYRFELENREPVEFRVTDRPAETEQANLPGWTKPEH
jgi:hypothetical protein